jgi:hypothetical protein
MTARKRFELDILCPSCGATGHARVSENDGPETADAVFRVDEYPPGFSEEKRSTSRLETLVVCRCGQVFYLS